MGFEICPKRIQESGGNMGGRAGDGLLVYLSQTRKKHHPLNTAQAEEAKHRDRPSAATGFSHPSGIWPPGHDGCGP